MNHALELLSKIQADGLPEFKAPITFVPCDKNVSSDCDSPGTKFKPDLAIMTLEDAREFYGLNELDAPRVSQFVSKIPKGCSTGSIGWKTILSAVEMKRKSDKKDRPPWECPNSKACRMDINNSTRNQTPLSPQHVRLTDFRVSIH